MSDQKTPKPIELENTVFDFDIHPSQDLILSGLINGKIHCHRYGLEEHELLWDCKPFKKSCRGVTFTPDGSHAYGISKDRSIQYLDISNGTVLEHKEQTHDNPLNALLCLNANLLATGDDQGVIKLWDNRKPDPVMTYTEHEDFIAQMVYNADKKTLVAVGGDGYLSTWDIRKPDVAAMSDHMEDELLSITLVKNNRKAVVGSQDGILSIWNWGDWGDYKDRIVGHPSSIDAICKLDEDTICTGSSDGIIRLVTILPNGFHGILGDHGEQMPVEHLKLAHDKKYLVSSGHDSSLQFWNVGHLFDEQQDDDNDDEVADDDENTGSENGNFDGNSASITETPIHGNNNDDDDSNWESEDDKNHSDHNENNETAAAPSNADSKKDDSWDDDSDDSDKSSKPKRKKQQKQKKAPQKKGKTSTFSLTFRKYVG
ncbi:WD40-repeat-containing domain protein [Absidia repens]|uniref:WD repeat-containing protein JIP5 n=1 Tax=Absidia repens TaxID=90262 RepID=A0A1X2ICA2_9FUNG|nr:WD40-repeat-containing domain protein [Absidia repens]